MFNENYPTQDSEYTDTRVYKLGSRLVYAIERDAKPPCEDRGDGRPCEHLTECALHWKACVSFFAYTREHDNRKEFGQWSTMERNPTKKLYAKTYRE